MGATLACSFGLAPCALSVLPTHRVVIGANPVANIMDTLSVVNISPFGLCSSPANPMVAAAAAAAMGVVTPMPCVPVTAAPWTPGSPTVLIDNMPALTAESRLMCTWGGVIQVMAPGQTTVLAS
jgi:hypothetical protein